MMSETVTMYLIVDDVCVDGRGSNANDLIPLGFTTREEAESLKRHDQKVIARDGCPTALALSIVEMSRKMLGKKELKE